MKQVTIGTVRVGNDLPLTVIAGPCQLESADHAQMIAGIMQEACAAVGAGYIFKASYDKANRSSLSGKRGVGMEAGLQILAGVKQAFGVPVLTDVHEPWHCKEAATVVDVLQIPALLCRQTDLLLAAGETGARNQCEEGPVPRALGHGQCRRQDSPRPGTSEYCFANEAPPSATTPLSPTCARCRAWRRPAIR